MTRRVALWPRIDDAHNGVNGPFELADPFTAGGGIRALVVNRVTVGIDARIGWELHLRVNGTIGLFLGP